MCTAEVYLACQQRIQAERYLRSRRANLTLKKSLHPLDEEAWVRFGAEKSVWDWIIRPTTERADLLSLLGATTQLSALKSLIHSSSGLS